MSTATRSLVLASLLILSAAFTVLAWEPCDAALPPLIEAAAKGDVDGVRRGIRHHADLTMKTDDGRDAMHWAASGGVCTFSCGWEGEPDVRADAAYASAVRCLVGAGADIESRDANGWTPLYAAASFGMRAVVSTLLELGADPDAAMSDRSTPLMAAAANGDLPMVKRLLQGSADPRAVADDGTSPLYLARTMEVARELVGWGAEPCCAIMDSSLRTLPSILCEEQRGPGS